MLFCFPCEFLIRILRLLRINFDSIAFRQTMCARPLLLDFQTSLHRVTDFCKTIFLDFCKTIFLPGADGQTPISVCPSGWPSGFSIKKKKKDQGQKKNTNEAFFGGGIDGYEYQYIFQNDWYAHLKS